MKVKIIATCGILITGLAAIGVVSHWNRSDQPAIAQLDEIRVSASKPSRGNLTQKSSFVGIVQPDESVQVFPKVSGTVLKSYFEVGEPVKKGQLLYEIDPEPFQAAYNAAAAQAEVTRLQLEQGLTTGYNQSLISLEANLKNAQSALESARDNLRSYNDGVNDQIIRVDKAVAEAEAAVQEAQAKLDQTDPKDPSYAQLEQALTQKEIALRELRDTLKDLEDDDDPQLRAARTAYRTAQRNYETALNAYNLATGDARQDSIAAADASIAAADAGLAAQAKQLEYTKIYAPIDGVIEQKNISEQNPSTSNSPAYIISNKSMMTVHFAVSQSVVENLSVGDKIEIENAGQTISGTILEIPTAVDPESGLFKIKAGIDDTEILLHTGTTVKVIADTQKAVDSILLPLDAIYYDAENPYVYCLRDGKAVKVEVSTGIASEEQIEIVSGLSEDDQVITSWHPRLIDGADVVQKETPVSSQPESPSSASSSEASSTALQSSQQTSSTSSDTQTVKE